MLQPATSDIGPSLSMEYTTCSNMVQPWALTWHHPMLSWWCCRGSLLCMLMISGKLIVSRYIAESITTDAGCFGHVGLCQLRTKLFCTQLTKAYVAETSCISCYWFCYVSAHDQFAQYRQRSNEPLRHYWSRGASQSEASLQAEELQGETSQV